MSLLRRFSFKNIPICWHTPSNAQALSFGCSVILLRLFWHSPSILLVFSFDFTELSSPQRLHGEPSLSQRRALAIETPSPRQLVESKGKLQSIPTCDSNHPLKWCTKSEGVRTYVKHFFSIQIIIVSNLLFNFEAESIVATFHELTYLLELLPFLI